MLHGGKLQDFPTGGAGADQFWFDSTDLVGATPQNDVIFDFKGGVAKIVLDNCVFTQLAGGVLRPANFIADANIVDTSGTDGNDYIKVDTVSRALYHDTSGNAAGGCLSSRFCIRTVRPQR